MEKVELLAPAGSLEKLKTAIIYGADAVYIGGEEFSLRAGAENFSIDEMKEGVEFAHLHKKKVYLTANIIPHNVDLMDMKNYFNLIKDIDIDGVIVSDPGSLEIAKEIIPHIDIHLSTQANNTNYISSDFWQKNGVKRIVLARELSFTEIKEIIEKSNKSLEFEVFVHGAMCISYSGRCLLSNYMVGRDSNQGNCSHPCRWKYNLVEEKRPNEYMNVMENERGTFIFNSKDLCMIEYIDKLILTGIKSLKIEGRIKSMYYVATIVGAYRRAIDDYYESLDKYKFDTQLLEEVKKVSHRNFTTGFYNGKPSGEDQVYLTSSYVRDYEFIGIVLGYNEETKMAKIEQRNRFFQGDTIEVLIPQQGFFSQQVEKIFNEDGELIEQAQHPKMIIYLKLIQPVKAYSILRKSKANKE